MTSKDEIKKYRDEIDGIDEKMVELFARRMECAEKIGELKQSGNIQILDSGREDEVLRAALSRSPQNMKNEVTAFMRAVMDISKARQSKII